MAKYIDAKKIKQTFCAECNHTLKCEDCDIDYHFRYAPAADVAEVRHGRWDELMEHRGAGGILGGKDICVGYACSECGEQSDIMTYYCPNCGALMNEVTE